jgi:hypothetical protein
MSSALAVAFAVPALVAGGLTCLLALAFRRRRRRGSGR